MKKRSAIFALIALLTLSSLSATAGVVASGVAQAGSKSRSMEVISHIQTAYSTEAEVASANVNSSLNDVKKLERTAAPASFDVQPIMKDGIVKTYAPVELTALTEQ